MGMLPTIYTARSDVPPPHRARVDDWYAHRHGPDLIRAGFYTAQVYLSEVGGPLVCNLYEIPGHDLFLTPAYRAVAANDAEGPAVIALLTNRSNTAYDQLVTVGVRRPVGDWSRGDRTGGVEAACLTTARFDLADSDEAALLEWYETHEGPRLQGRPGFRASRLCRRGPPHPVAASRDPRWFVINEWEDPAAALADGPAETAGARCAAAFPGRLSSFVYNVGRRVLRLP
jgi:hypothetical protein